MRNPTEALEEEDQCVQRGDRGRNKRFCRFCAKHMPQNRQPRFCEVRHGRNLRRSLLEQLSQTTVSTTA
jgi:hypothetical protein